ncbi:MAG: diguanylate cyclase [Planctomycetota bacterium]|jgi:diguanylate cyclase (GGDEF)-like protein
MSAAKGAEKDALTGLATYRVFQTALAEAIDKASEADEEMCLAMVDLDEFKALNDGLGHRAGDELIKGTARQLAKAVQGKGRAFRYGGEEFALLLPGMEREEALFFLEGVRRDFDKNPTVNTGKEKEKVHMTFSAGIASYPTDGDGGKSVISKADDALYRAKATGRDKVCLSREEKMVTRTSHYTQGQLRRLSMLAKKEGVGEAVLLREGLDDLFRKYNDLERGK